MKNTKTNYSTGDANLRLQAIIDTAIDGIITIDRRGIVETVNPAAARLFGYEPEEIIGNNISMLMPSPDREQHDGYIGRYLSTRQPHIIGIGREVKGLRKNGEIFPLRLAVSEVQLEGRIIFTGIIHDLSEVKKAEEAVRELNAALQEQNRDLDRIVKERTEKLAKTVDQLIQTNNQLKNEIEEREKVEAALREREKELRKALEKEKELNELKTRFVSIASHEFRTPLSTILSSVELVEAYKKEDQHPKRLKHTQRIKNAVAHLTSILNDFLSLSRLEDGVIPLEPENINLEDFCRDMMDDLRLQLKPGQQLLHSAHFHHKEVWLDKKCLQHILFNLLSNAIKYSKENQEIECRMEVFENELKIMVRDEGIGIPEEDQKHLFTRFFRARNVENIKGTGLGLNIVRRYLDMLGGTIKFKSKQGVGTVFQVTIPLKQDVPAR
ncbi:MAG: PAS domain S-box protein [Bacteroidetes bacterium]|nr:MAG: PAS domain S-box protein [Bacteroidota bacterium]